MELHLRKPQIGIISDFHIGNSSNSSTKHNIALEWAKWFRSELEKNQIEDIIFCGDFFHYRDEISVNTLHIGSDIINIFKDFNLIMIVGNHCAYNKNNSLIHSLSVFRNQKNITVIDEIIQSTLYNKNVVLSPWGSTIKQLIKYKPIDYLFGHFEINNFKWNNTKLCDDGEDSKNFLDIADRIITGHFHMRQHRYYDNKKKYILYVGSPYHLDFTDENERGYHILNFEDNSIRFIENTFSPFHLKIPISKYISPDKKSINKERLESIPIQNNFIKVVVDENIDIELIESFKKSLSKQKPIELVTDFQYQKKPEYLAQDVDLSGINIEQAIREFVNNSDITNKEEVINYTLELYSKVK